MESASGARSGGENGRGVTSVRSRVQRPTIIKLPESLREAGVVMVVVAYPLIPSPSPSLFLAHPLVPFSFSTYTENQAVVPAFAFSHVVEPSAIPAGCNRRRLYKQCYRSLKGTPHIEPGQLRPERTRFPRRLASSRPVQHC